MRRPLVKRIFARTDQTDFVGRASHVDRLLKHARDGSGGLLLLVAPRIGTSELLRHAYDRLFIEQGETIPFYFEFRKSDRTAHNAARRFLREFLQQTVAFRRADPKIIESAPDLNEIADLAVPEDGYWVDRLVEMSVQEGLDDPSSIRNCLSAPLRAAANGARPFLLVDNLHVAKELGGGEALFDAVSGTFERASLPIVLAGRRRALFASTEFDTIPFDTFSFEEAGAFAKYLSRKSGVKMNEQTRDLVAVQLVSNAGFISSIFAAALAAGHDLNSFEHVEQVYTDEIFGGRIGCYFDELIEELVSNTALRSKVIWLLAENLAARSSSVPVNYWRRHLHLPEREFEVLLDSLHQAEILNVSSDSVVLDPENIVLCDWIAGRKRLEMDREQRALVVGDTLAKNIKRAPQLLARFYRQTSSIGLRGLLSAFDGRRISGALFDYSRFKEELKGVDDERALKLSKEDNTVIELPHIVYTAKTSAFYPKLNEKCEPERSAVGLGFRDNANRDEVAWVVVQIDSKLEAKRDVTGFWCDRLEMVAVASGFKAYQLWLIAPEGFDPEAIGVLNDRGAIGSSHKQVDLLASLLNADMSPEKADPADDYEIVVPMGEDTEMIAAHTVEEIAKRHNFPTRSINQIKTALVEACINATEHSLSPDRRIHQKFSVAADKITITVTNRGVRLTDKQPNPNAPDAARRGWGLKLIKGLMDEVNINKTDDGTQITMVKYLQKAAAAGTT